MKAFEPESWHWRALDIGSQVTEPINQNVVIHKLCGKERYNFLHVLILNILMGTREEKQSLDGIKL